MSKKITLTLYSCKQCPNLRIESAIFGRQPPYCIKTDRIINYTESAKTFAYGPIPDWCPLEDDK